PNRPLGGRAARARARATRRLVSLSRSGMEGGLALLVEIVAPPRPQQPEAAEQTREVAPEREAQRRRGAHLAVGVVQAPGQRRPRLPDVEAGRLPAVEAVLVAVVGRERERVAR